MPEGEWEFRYVIDHVPDPGEPMWSEWSPVRETSERDDFPPEGHDVEAMTGTAIVQFRRKPIKCQGWINLASVSDELRPLTSVRVYCDVPAGEKHPTDGDGEPLHQYRTIYWDARSVPEDGDDDA